MYFNYPWIFKQNHELIKHILGEDKSESKDDAWIERMDALTENKHYVNYGQIDQTLPKMRFDTDPKRNRLPMDTTTSNDRYRDSKKKNIQGNICLSI